MTGGEARGKQELGSPLLGPLVGVGVEQGVYGDSDGSVKGEGETFFEDPGKPRGGFDQPGEPELRDFEQLGRAGKSV